MLLHRLFLLVGLTALPFIGLLVYGEVDEYRERRAEIDETLLAQTRATAGEYERLLTGARYLMFTLARLPALNGSYPAACSAMFRDIGDEFRTYSSIAAFDRDGALLCSSRPVAETGRLADRSLLNETLFSERFTVGAMVHEYRRDRRHLPLGMPFTGADGTVRGVLLLTVDLTAIVERIAGAQPGAGTAILVADREGTILLTQPVWTGWVDMPLPAPLAGAMNASAPGIVEAADPDGQLRLWATLPRDQLPMGLFITTGKLKTVAFAVVNEAILRSIVGTLIVILLAHAIAAWGASRFIHRPIAGLLAAIEKWRPGEEPLLPPASKSRGEFDRIASGFAALEQRANALFRHRELLMKELQHRVLNTLQILSSVLGLQAHRASTPEARAALEEAQQRIRAVAAVYHRLYELERAQEVDLAQFLRALAHDLGEAYGTEHLAGRSIAVEAETCHTDPANTISLAMVVTELIANAVKYAGSAGRSPHIILRCQRRDDGSWTIDVEDNGPGLSDEPDDRRKGSLGVVLVHRLMQQLNGSVTYLNTDHGLIVRLFLPAAFARAEGAAREADQATAGGSLIDS